ncbi:hypothetical protein VTJ04DRAFT_3076 [Mycothermus thermophilus]|uniref:uncharacterized protein n=1 Tax=Humicola insolens TaxID=85995 RepID=UPI0037435B34
MMQRTVGMFLAEIPGSPASRILLSLPVPRCLRNVSYHPGHHFARKDVDESAELANICISPLTNVRLRTSPSSARPNRSNSALAGGVCALLFLCSPHTSPRPAQTILIFTTTITTPTFSQTSPNSSEPVELSSPFVPSIFRCFLRSSPSSSSLETHPHPVAVAVAQHDRSRLRVFESRVFLNALQHPIFPESRTSSSLPSLASLPSSLPLAVAFISISRRRYRNKALPFITPVRQLTHASRSLLGLPSTLPIRARDFADQTVGHQCSHHHDQFATWPCRSQFNSVFFGDASILENWQQISSTSAACTVDP